MKIFCAPCGHTNCYIIDTGTTCIMIDTGWAGTLPLLGSQLKENGLKISDIKHLIITHFHPDHAGIAQELKDLGANLILHEIQLLYIDAINVFYQKNPKYSYKNILTQGNAVLTSAQSRLLFNELGFKGEIISTPGHSADSVSVILDGCCAFVGDLPEFSLIEAYNDQLINDSWALLKSYAIKKVYPAHGRTYYIK